MAKRKPTPDPTLTQLRKLAKLKGMDIFRRGTPFLPELWWQDGITHFATIHAPIGLRIVRRSLLGILSALPDVPTKRGRHV